MQLGLKSESELYKLGSKHVSILKDESKITFMPSKPAGKPYQGFVFKSSIEFVCISIHSSDDEIFDALELALQKCN